MTTYDLERAHDAARSLNAIIRARWGGDDQGATQVLEVLSPNEMRDAVWSVSGLVASALVLPADTDPSAFLAATALGIDRSLEHQQTNDQEDTDDE